MYNSSINSIHSNSADSHHHICLILEQLLDLHCLRRLPRKLTAAIVADSSTSVSLPLSSSSLAPVMMVEPSAGASQLLASSVLSVSYRSDCFCICSRSEAAAAAVAPFNLVALWRHSRISSVSMMTIGVAPSVSCDLSWENLVVRFEGGSRVNYNLTYRLFCRS